MRSKTISGWSGLHERVLGEIAYRAYLGPLPLAAFRRSAGDDNWGATIAISTARSDEFWDGWWGGVGGGAAQQFAGFPFVGWAECLEESDFACGKEGGGNSVAIEHAIAGKCGEFFSRRDDARKVQRVHARDGDHAPAHLVAPDLAQHWNCIGQRKLFARESCNESAAPDFTLSLQPTVNP